MLGSLKSLMMFLTSKLYNLILSMKEGQENARQIVDILNVRNPDSKAFQSKFEILNNSVTHQNRIEVQLLPTKNQQLEVRNYFANISKGQVVKITEIRLEDRVIKIIDSFDSKINLPLVQLVKAKEVPVNISETIRPLCSHRNLLEKKMKPIHRDHDQQYEQVKVRDTKNVVKNIFRLFQNWIEEKASSQRQQHLSSALQALLSANGKYNNNLIISISHHLQLRISFIAFCEMQANQMIGQSKIHDKQSHIDALRRYKRICEEEQAIYNYELKSRQKRRMSQGSHVSHHISSKNGSGSNSNSNSNSQGNGDGNGSSDKDNKNPSSSSTNATNGANELAEQAT